ncbi:MAG: hypothetical protein ACRCYS_12855, partial [Beijerinckiaceae bacterium]
MLASRLEPAAITLLCVTLAETNSQLHAIARETSMAKIAPSACARVSIIHDWRAVMRMKWSLAHLARVGHWAKPVLRLLFLIGFASHFNLHYFRPFSSLAVLCTIAQF